MISYHGPERRKNAQISDEDFERIVDAAAERSAQIARDNFAKEVGNGAIKLVMWTIGVATIAVLGWLGLKGSIK